MAFGKLGTGVFLAVIVIGVVSCGPDSHTLALSLDEGANLKQREETVSSVTFRVQGQSIRITTTYRGEETYVVESVAPKGAATLRQTVDVHELTMTSGGSLGGLFEGAFSNTELRDALRERLGGHVFTVSIEPTGEVTAVTGGDEFVEALLTEMAVPVGVQQVNTRYALREAVGNEGLKDALEERFDYLASTPLHVGDTWTGESVLRDEMALKLTTTYTLESVENGIATVRFKGNAEALPFRADLAGLPAGANIKITATGTHSGLLKIDTATGWLQDKDMTISADGTLGISMQGVIEASLGLPFEYQYTVTSRRTS